MAQGIEPGRRWTATATDLHGNHCGRAAGARGLRAERERRQPVTQALNPAPPDFYSCSATGGGTICRATTSQDYGPDPTGIFCGSGAGAFEVTDQATRTIAATRWYDRDGNLVRRLRQISFDDARFANPLNTLSVSYHQRNTDDEHFAVPGDFDSVTLYDHGVISVNLPGRGNTVSETGRLVFGPDGSLLSQAGQSEFSAYYGGDASVVDGLCAALS